MKSIHFGVILYCINREEPRKKNTGQDTPAFDSQNDGRRRTRRDGRRYRFRLVRYFRPKRPSVNNCRRLASHKIDMGFSGIGIALQDTRHFKNRPPEKASTTSSPTSNASGPMEGAMPAFMRRGSAPYSSMRMRTVFPAIRNTVPRQPA